MKKILTAIALSAMAGSVMAADDYVPASTTTLKPIAANYIYKTETDREDRNFIKNDFPFTLSANVVMISQEDETNKAWFAVGTYNSAGRNIFTGHSDGGSITSCGDPLTQGDVKDGKLATELDSRFDETGVEPSACTTS